MPKYKHMMPEDEPVWDRWLTKHQPADDVTLSYDVQVGTPVQLPADFPEPYRDMAEGLSKKRIDVVITWPDHITIVEVKGMAGWTAIGQCIGYPVLFVRDFAPELPVTVLLVTAIMRPDIDQILDAYDIPYEIV